MPPTISARIDEETVDELKEQTGAEKDSEALREAVDYAIHQPNNQSVYFGLLMPILFATFEAYGEFTVAEGAGPYLLALTVAMLVFPRASRMYQNWSQ